MRRSSMTIGLPPFTPMVKRLIIINSAIYVLMLLLRGLAPALANSIEVGGALVPVWVMKGAIWQLFTYSFLHAGLFHLLFNMLSLWMVGGQLEMDWGRRKFLEFYFYCVLGAAVTTILVGLAGRMLIASHPAPLFFIMASLLHTPTVGASGGIFGLFIAYAKYYGDREFLLYFILPIKARIMVAILIFIALVGALGGSSNQAVANFAHLGGAFFGWIYVRFLPNRGLGFATSEGWYGLRNTYTRWKRRRAARKFEVYMRGQKQPTNYRDYFDEYGNYKAPPDNDKDSGKSSRGPWVN